MTARKPGARVYDRRRNRTLVLIARVNPVGRLIPAYWVVENTVTGRRTVIRENRMNGARWTDE